MSSPQCQTAQSPVVSFRQHRVGLFGLVSRWQERAAQRAHLASLADHMLKDIGISRADAELEAGKPFWRP